MESGILIFREERERMQVGVSILRFSVKYDMRIPDPISYECKQESLLKLTLIIFSVKYISQYTIIVR